MTATDGGILPLIFLNALPAGGKSEIRRFLENTDPAVRRARFHIGDIVSLDDYPYVHFMRRIDDELNKVGFPSMFFVLPDRGFLTDLDWCTLIKLVSDDYYIAGSKIEPIAGVLMTDPSAKKPMPTAAARWIFSRIDRARASVGILRRISQLPAEVLDELACQLGNECLNFYKELRKNAPYDRTNKTVIIEFSRGASAGAELPFAYPLGYAHSYSKFENSILNNASVLYVSVSPEMSRAKVRVLQILDIFL